MGRNKNQALRGLLECPKHKEKSNVCVCVVWLNEGNLIYIYHWLGFLSGENEFLSFLKKKKYRHI